MKSKVYIQFPLEEQRTISSGYNIRKLTLIPEFIDATSKRCAQFPFFIMFVIVIVSLILSTQSLKKINRLANNSHPRKTHYEAVKRNMKPK